MHDGTGAWSIDDIVEYLKTGRNKHSNASGLMAEVVENSTSKLPESDLHAIATYIKDIDGGPKPPPPAAQDKTDPQMTAGAAIFADSCSGCHQADGSGVPRMFPPLQHNANVQQRDPSTVIRIILQGARTAATDKRPTPFSMPAFNWKLKDDEVAAVATYVRNAWGNHAPPVDGGQVHDMRQNLKKTGLAADRSRQANKVQSRAGCGRRSASRPRTRAAYVIKTFMDRSCPCCRLICCRSHC